MLESFCRGWRCYFFPTPQVWHAPRRSPRTKTRVVRASLPRGSFCSPKCSHSKPCPADTHKGATAKGECVLEVPGSSSPSQCALICRPGSGRGGCPIGADCVPIQGLGICTYKPKDDAEKPAAEENPELMEAQN